MKKDSYFDSIDLLDLATIFPEKFFSRKEFSLNQKLLTLLNKSLLVILKKYNKLKIASNSSNLSLPTFKVWDVAADHSQLIISLFLALDYLFKQDELKISLEDKEILLNLSKEFLANIKFIASDCSVDSLNKGKDLANKLELTSFNGTSYLAKNKIDFLVLDGLFSQVLDSDDIIFIAGVGGDTLLHIMANKVTYRKGVHLFLHPTSSIDRVRFYLAEWGFEILKEIILLEKNQIFVLLEIKYTQDVDLRLEYKEEDFLSSTTYFSKLKKLTSTKLHNVFFGRRGNQLFLPNEDTEKVYFSKVKKYLVNFSKNKQNEELFRNVNLLLNGEEI